MMTKVARWAMPACWLLGLFGACRGQVNVGENDGAAGAGESSAGVAGRPRGPRADAGAAGDESLGGVSDGSAGSASGAPTGGGGSGTGGSSTAGDATTGGTGGAAPYVATNACDGSPVELDDELVRWCVVTSSCTGREIGACLSEGGKDVVMSFYSVGAPHPPFTAKRPISVLPQTHGCPAGVETCDEVLACSGFKLPETECDSSQAARCEGDLAINCGRNHSVLPMVTDCTHVTGEAGACRLVGTGDEAHALCVVADDCDGAEGAETCDGDVLRRCVSGATEGIDCSAFDLTCEELAPGHARCALPLPEVTCDEPGAAYCDGDSPAYCNPDGLLFELAPCNQVGEMTCQSGEGMENLVIQCDPQDCRHEPEDPGQRDCEGDDYVFIDGLGLRLHCPAYGFATCRESRCTN